MWRWNILQRQQQIITAVTTKLGNVCYHSVQNLSSRLLSRNLHQNIQNYNFTCCFVWVWNLVSHIRGRAQIMFENIVLRRIFRPKSKEVVGDWEKPRNFYASPNLFGWSQQGWDGRACSTHGWDEKFIKVLVRKPQGKRPPGRPTRRWLDKYYTGSYGNRVRGCGLDSSGSGYGPVAHSCE